MTAIAGPARQTVLVDGCEISYRRAGSGEPVVFLHGVNGANAWEPWMDRLAERYDVIVPDHPGWGRSAMPEWLDNIHDLAYFYLDFLCKLDLRGVHLIGHSMGGWIAAELAVRNGDDLTSLTLVAPAGLRALGVQKFDIFITAPEALAHALFHDPALAEARLALPPPTDDELDVQLRNRFAAARICWQPRLFDPHLHKWLHRIDVPTLVLWGAEDRILQVAHSAEFVSRIAGAREMIVPACGHIPMIEKPAETLAAIETFLKENGL